MADGAEIRFIINTTTFTASQRFALREMMLSLDAPEDQLGNVEALSTKFPS